MENKLCKTCKHWIRPENYTYGEILGVGKCTAIVQFWNATEWIEDDNPIYKQFIKYSEIDCLLVLVLKPKYETKLAFMQGSSDCHAELITKPDFGCVQHESIQGYKRFT